MSDDLAQQSKVFYFTLKLGIAALIGYVFIWAVLQLK